LTSKNIIDPNLLARRSPLGVLGLGSLNFRYTFRTLRDSLGLTCTILLTIALGIGANTAIFTVAYATLLAPLPHPQPNRLVNVWSKFQGHRDAVSAPDFIDWKRQSTSFVDLNAAGTTNSNIATKDRPEFLEGLVATPGYFGMLGNPVFLGRNFLPEEGGPGKAHVVILTQLRRMLIVGEFALSLAGARLSIHSFWNLTHVDLGVRTDHILGFYVNSVPIIKDASRTKTMPYYRSILASIKAVPGVSNVCAMSRLPLDGLHDEMPFSIAGKPAYQNPLLGPNADLEVVTPDYFQTFGIRIVKGRGFTDADNESSVRVAMVNEVFASRFLKGDDPLRQRLVMEQLTGGPRNGPAIEWQIVGVFHTVKSRGSREDNPEIDIPFWQEAFPLSGVGVRTAEDPSAMIKSIAAVNAVDPQAALWKPRTMEEVHDVMAFSVTQRSREIALRMALGATRNGVIALVMKEGAVLAGTGLGLGFNCAYFVGRAMQSILFGVSAIDFSAFGAVGLLLLLAALLASSLPALRAGSVETMQFLRSE
jgi:hypothetical protein